MYKPLSNADVKAIYDTALRLLEELGMGEVPDRLAKDFEKMGAVMGEDGRVRFSKALVEDVIELPDFLRSVDLTDTPQTE